MKFNVVGSEKGSGSQCTVVIEAESVEEAARAAGRRLSQVEAVAAASSASPSDSEVHADDQRPHAPQESRLGAFICRPIVVSLGLAAPAFLFAPAVTIDAGAVLALSLVAMALAPKARPLIGRSLGIRHGQGIRSVAKFALYTVYAPCLLVLGYVGAQMHEQAVLAQREQLARDKVAMQRKAEATVKVNGMLTDARAELERENVARASELAREAAKVALAANVGQAQKLVRAIDGAEDPKHILLLLTSMPESEFESFRAGQATPRSLDFGFAALSNVAIRSAREQMEQATAIRRELAARVKAEQEAQRRDAEQRAAAIREKAQAEAARVAAEQAERQKDLQGKLDAYLGALDGTSLVASVSVQHNSVSWEATVTVTNLWHMRVRQVRLQDAQALWELWASIASPTDQDRARIKIVDLRGNEVGGSRVWGGSLIWVQD